VPELEAGHYAQVHGSDHRALIQEVCDYIAGGLDLGETAIAIATPEHRDVLFAALSGRTDASRCVDDGTLYLLDAQETLDQFMVRGYPDAQRFDAAIGERLRDLWARSAGVRAFGEMVGVLWQSRRYPAAIRLEQLWNGLRRQIPFSLYCAYPIDVFGSGFDSVAAHALLRAHTHFLPADPSGSLERAVARAAKELLGSTLDGFKQDPHLKSLTECGTLPVGESMILWVQTSHADRAGEVLERARTYYFEGSTCGSSIVRVSGSTARSSVP
jgi:hypothetical protein